MGDSEWENLSPGQSGQILGRGTTGKPEWKDAPGAGADHTLPDDPGSVRLSDGTAFYKPTTPQDTQPVSLAAQPLPTGAATEATAAAIKAGTDKIPAAPSQEHTTATSPHAVRLSNGAGFIAPTTPADTQLVQAPALAKGVQGANGFSTQDLKDAGRVLKVFSAVNFSTATTEALVSLTPITDGAAGGAATSFGVTAGKRLRLLGMTLSARNAGAVIQGVIVKLRMTATGAVAANSPCLATLACQTPGATAAHVAHNSLMFPEGIELSGTMQIGVSQLGIGAAAGNDVTLWGFEY